MAQKPEQGGAMPCEDDNGGDVVFVVDTGVDQDKDEDEEKEEEKRPSEYVVVKVQGGEAAIVPAKWLERVGSGVGSGCGTVHAPCGVGISSVEMAVRFIGAVQKGDPVAVAWAATFGKDQRRKHRHIVDAMRIGRLLDIQVLFHTAAKAYIANVARTALKCVTS